MKNSNIISLIRQNEMKFSSIKDQNEFESLLVNRLLNSKDEFVDLLVRMESSASGSAIFSQLVNL